MLSTTLIPIICLIFLGLILKRRQFVSNDFWQHSDRMVYYVFFPALLVSNISKVDLQKVPVVELGSAVTLLLLAMTATLVIIQAIKPTPAPAFTSVYQGAIRFNTFIALTVIAATWQDPHAMEVASLIVGIKVLLINILSVSVFAIYLNKSDSFAGKLKTVFNNPLIIACISGFVINLLPVDLPLWLLTSLEMLGRVALVLGLLSVGAGLILSFNDWVSGPIVLAVVLKLVLFPLAALGIGYGLGLDQLTLQVLVAIFAMPTAINAYILAGQLGGDQRVMAKDYYHSNHFICGHLNRGVALGSGG